MWSAERSVRYLPLPSEQIVTLFRRPRQSRTRPNNRPIQQRSRSSCSQQRQSGQTYKRCWSLLCHCSSGVTDQMNAPQTCCPSLDLLDHVRAGFFQLVVLSLEPEVEKEEALAKLIGWVLEQALLRDSCSTVCVAGDSQQLEQLREAGRKKAQSGARTPPLKSTQQLASSLTFQTLKNSHPRRMFQQVSSTNIFGKVSCSPYSNTDIQNPQRNWQTCWWHLVGRPQEGLRMYTAVPSGIGPV